jgi:hypothetical protein
MGSILHNCSKPLASGAWTGCGKGIPRVRCPVQPIAWKELAGTMFLSVCWQWMCFPDEGTSSKVLDFFEGKSVSQKIFYDKERACA